MPLCNENLLFVDNQTFWPLTAIRAGKTTLKMRRKGEGEEVGRGRRQRRRVREEGRRKGEGIEQDGDQKEKRAERETGR